MSTDARRRRIVTLVSGLGAAQSVAVVTQISATGDAVRATIFGAGATAQLVITLLSAVFLTVAVTVTGVVVAGATEIALTGQVREIALRRLLGASARDERRRAARATLRRAGVGMAVGAVAGQAVSLAALELGLSGSPQLHLGGAALVPSPLLLVALLAQALTTRGAVRRGTRGVLDIPPAEALRLTADADAAVPATFAVPPRASGATLALGLVLLAGSVALSVITPLAMLPAVAGGVVSFVGLVSHGERFVPPLLRVVRRLLPGTLGVTLAARSLERHPQRTSRAVLGVAATVTLVTTFVVGIASFQRAVDAHYAGSAVAGLAADVLDAVVGVVYVLTAFLALTAGVALANAVAFGAWLRRRDTALLRILGQSSRGTRATMLAQSALITLTATVVGVVLGTAYGWIGAQSVFGVEARGAMVVPVVPVLLLAGLGVAAAVLTVLASLVPIRASLRLPPITAYTS